MDDSLTTTWVERLAAGDSVAAQRAWQHYYRHLVGLARRKLGGAARGMADEEDVAAIAFHSFFRGIQAGRFPQLEDRHDLWQVLVMLTARKAADQLQFAARQKRGGGRAAQSPPRSGDDSSIDGLDQVVGREPTPAFAAEVAEQLQRFLDALQDSTLQRIAVGKLEGFTNQELANELDCGVRTIERKLKLIRTVWAELGDRGAKGAPP